MFAVLALSDFALHAVLRTESAVADRPAALFAGPGRKSVVLAATPAARAAGVEPGMTAPQAVARCPGLVIRTPQPAAEAEARAALHAVAFTLGPLIEDTAPGVCTIDLKGAANRPEPVAAAAVRQLAALGLPAAAGIGRTPLLARYAAEAAGRAPAVRDGRATLPAPGAGREDTPASRSGVRSGADGAPPSPAPRPTAPSAASSACAEAADLPPSPAARAAATSRDRPPRAARKSSAPAPVTADLALPFACAEAPAEIGPTAVFPGEPVRTITDEAGFLARLPLAVAEPPPELAAVLHTWGLRTCGDLTALPRDEIVRRFGAAGLDLWWRARGGEPRPLRPVVPAAQFAAAMDFEQPVETLEPLLFLLRRFLDRLTLEVRAAQFVAAELALTLRLEDDTAHARRFRLPEPTADPEILFRALHTHLETLQTGAAITGLELRLEPARPLVRQHGLFDTGLRDPHGFAETLARVAALVHADRVGTPQPADTHRPDAFTLQPPAAVVPPPAPPPVHPPFGLPLRRFRPPLPATLEFSRDDRRPAYLHTAPFQGAIAEVRGPWRSSGDWWQADRAWARLEWDIALADGGLYRLLRVGEAYFVEGEYD